ncbi:hypothetical protein PVK06_029782 [Gossypium arboreum]|uniref:Reverse transcriptase zinc-binding domain-containing protein n=1 Tax=Gossypium arboreum TaxID=29729 RepID=A0ABR0NLI0_GOSAR|nr:hypothetical protein PVK06_029782 [Gossypium arboreum]
MPINVSVKIERIAQGFIRGKDIKRQKMSLIKWSNCCQPLINGGLGFQNLKNDSFLLKLGFNLFPNKQALWVKIIRTKYNDTEVYPENYSGGIPETGTLTNFCHNTESIPPPSPLVGKDELIFSWSTHEFSKSKRVRHFLWLVLNEHLLTNVEQCRRGLVRDPSCALCGNVEESTIHIFRDCVNAREVQKPETSASSPMKKRRDQVWTPSPARCIKLNTDRARDPILRIASIAAVARDEFGTWRGGVGRNIGRCNVMQAKL